MTFKALSAKKIGYAISLDVVATAERNLMRGDFTVAVEYSNVNSMTSSAKE
jgi:hypothetical protein